jgi:hypothetical protein
MHFHNRALGLSAKAPVAVALLVLALTLSAGAQRADYPDGRIHDQLWNEEQKLATAEKQQTRAYFQQKLDNDLIFVAYNGEVFTKNKILQALHYIDVSRYTIQNFKVRPLGPNAGLVTYDLDLNGKIAGHELPAKQYASSVWLKRGAQWVLIFHQSTPADHH